MLSRCLVAIAIVVVIASPACATTWGSSEYDCPLCGAKGKYETPMSCGSYIYDWPSKYQLVFWPRTTSLFVYWCQKCSMACYMGDFDQTIPADRRVAVRSAIADVRITSSPKTYWDIPMSARLRVAERVYKALGRDDEFWCDFRRLQGFWFEAEGNAVQAREARLKSLALAKKLAEVTEAH